MAGDLNRRELLAIPAAGWMIGGGMRRLDQRQTGVSRAGSGPAPSQQPLVNPVIIVTPGKGVFVYSGTPGVGNLVASITAAGGTDPYGNAVQGGVVSYAPLGHLFAELFSGALTLGSTAAGSLVVSDGGVAFTDALVAATAPSLVVASPAANLAGGAESLVQLFGMNNSASLLPQVVIAGVNSGATSTPVTNAMLEVQGGAAQQVARLITDVAATLGLGITVSGDTNPRLNATGAGNLNWGSGSAAADVSLLRPSANLLRVGTADFQIHTAGRGLQVAEGANAKQGTATLAAGTILVANTSVTASSRILLTAQDNNTTGALRISARVAGTSFTITSSNAADTGVVAWEIFEPG